jgi:CRP/FNR family transcriptional regulator
MPRAAFLSLFGRGYLDAVELRGLSQLANKVEFRAGKTIFSEGDPANAVFGLSRGLVRLYKSLPDGRRQVLAFAVPGDLVGMPLRERHTCSADAIGDVDAWRFSRTEFSKFAQTSLSMLRLLNHIASRDLEMAQELLLLVCQASAEERVTTFLVNWRNRFASLNTRSPVLALPMRRQDIADFLGLTLETVSRTFAKLHNKGTVRIVPKGVVLGEDWRTPRAK